MMMVSVHLMLEDQYQLLSTLIKHIYICFEFNWPPQPPFLAGIKGHWLFLDAWN